MKLSASALIFVLVTGLGWGLLGPASKALFGISPHLDGVSLAVARAAWVLPIFLIGLGVGWRLDPPRLDARHWWAVLGAAALFGPAISLLFTIAAQHTSVAHISFLIGISPVTNTALAAFVFREPLDRRAWIALGLGITGVALLALARDGGGSALLGDGIMVVWLAAFGGYACFVRFLGGRMSSALLMCLIMSIAMLLLLIPTLPLGFGYGIAHVADTPAAAGWFFGEIVLGSTLIAQLTYASAVRRAGVSVATIGAEYTALAVGVAMSIFAAHERWVPLTVVAGLVFCAALTVTFAPLPGLRTQTTEA